MKKIAVMIALGAAYTASFAQDTYVHGYVTRDGTYVAPHMRTAPDASLYNNYSTQGNYNPYAGQAGTVNPYAYHAPAPVYIAPLPQPRLQPLQPLRPIQPLQLPSGPGAF